jgi:anti-sigma B factor antagonist
MLGPFDRFDLVLPDRLDATTAAQVRDAMSLAVDGTPAVDVLVDVSAVRVIDGVGLGLLLAAHRSCRKAGRRLVLVDPSPGVLRLLAVTRLHRVLHVDRVRVAAGA